MTYRKKDILLFLLIVFITSYVLILLGQNFVLLNAGEHRYYRAQTYRAQNFLPALAFMIIILKKDNVSKIPKSLFVVFFMAFLYTLFAPLISQSISSRFNSFFDFGMRLIFSALFLLFVFKSDKRKLERISIIDVEYKNTIFSSIFLLLLPYIIINYIFLGDKIEYFNRVYLGENMNIKFVLFTFSITLLVEFICYFGIEFGFRTFLQKTLENNLGGIKAMVLTSFIYVLWLLPINVIFFDLKGYGILSFSILAFSLSLLLSHIYEKTNSIWSVALLHLVARYIFVFFHDFARISVTNKFNSIESLPYSLSLLLLYIFVIVFDRKILYTKRERISK